MMRRLASTLLVAASTTLWAGPAAAVNLTISCFSTGGFAEACRSGVADWERTTGHKVNLFYQPEDTTALLAMNRLLLEARSPEVDVYQIDVIWPGLLAPHFLDLAPYFTPEDLADHFPALVANNRVDGRLVAIPWYTDAGLLYFRRDLLEKYGFRPPETWEQLAAAARTVIDREARSGLYGYVWQGRAYEGLTCNALEWIASHGGGTLVEADGTVSLDNPRAIQALRTAAGWLGTITPWEVLFYGEAESRDVFRAGDAVFMRNWPFAWHDLNGPGSAVAGKVGIAPLPRGPGAAGRVAATLGGWQLAVSRYSAHPAESAALIRHLAGQGEQKRRAILWTYSPTYPALYRDPAVRAATPIFEHAETIFAHGVSRPSQVVGAAYDTVSSEVWTAVYAILSGNGDAAGHLAGLAARLTAMRGGARW